MSPSVKPFTMPVPRASALTLTALAGHLGLSLATVSYALRGDPKIPPSTREREQAAARELGYRPNPRVSSLMAHIRRAHARAPGERIAFVWVHTTREDVGRDPFLRMVFRGARERAEQTGFGLEEYWTQAPGMSERRLQQIIRSRGIVGVVLSPVTTDEASLTLDWDWGQFAVAVIGNVSWTPELHHAGHHHYLGMRLALNELARLGCRRPAALLEHDSNHRAKRAWEAAWLTHPLTAGRARPLLRTISPGHEAPDTTAGWLRTRKPDAVVASAARLFDLPGVRGFCTKSGIAPVTLHWSKEGGVGGVDQCYDRIAAHAVDLVIAQLNSNETGPPDLPSMMLFPGRWVAPPVPKSGPRSVVRPA